MAPYITDPMPVAQVPMGLVPVPGFGQSPPGSGVYMQEINGVTYFSQQPFPMTGVHVYPVEQGSAGYNSPLPEGGQSQNSPGGWGATQEMPQHQPSPQAGYTSAPCQPACVDQPQMVPVMMSIMSNSAPVPQQIAYYYSPGSSTASSVQFSAGSPVLTASSTPTSGPSPAPPSTGASGSRASTPASFAGGRPEHIVGESLSTRLEVVWHGKFEELFKSYPHHWTLSPIADTQSVEGEGVNKYMDSAKVRFICPHCKNCWTSMKGRVYFLYALDPVSGQGFVMFKLFGQKCSKCPDKDYVHSMWYADEIEKVIANIHQKVGQTYYGVTTPMVRVDRRRGQPKKPHPLMACQACDVGICREEHNFR